MSSPRIDRPVNLAKFTPLFNTCKSNPLRPKPECKTCWVGAGAILIRNFQTWPTLFLILFRNKQASTKTRRAQTGPNIRECIYGYIRKACGHGRRVWAKFASECIGEMWPTRRWITRADLLAAVQLHFLLEEILMSLVILLAVQSWHAFYYSPYN